MNDIRFYLEAAELLTPALWVVAGAVVTLLWPLFFPKQKVLTPAWALLTLTLAAAALLTQTDIPYRELFGGVYTVDQLTVTFGLIAILATMIVVLMTVGYEHHLGANQGEFYAVLLIACASVMLLAGATDLILVFVALETLSISCVILSGFLKKDRKSNEAALKYFLTFAATTATLMYGLTFAYGLSFDGQSGSTRFADIHVAMMQHALQPSLLFILMMVFIVSAVGFKLSMVPFHMWTPDVYEGAPTPVTAFLSIVSKAGGFVLAIRLLMMVFISAAVDWGVLIGCLAILSMVVGNLIALVQTSFKRMLAYSSIAHVGYILIGLVAGTADGLAAMIFYIIVYGLMNLGAFAGAILFTNETGSDNIDDYAGLVRKRPWLAAGMSVCLLNLAALPLPPAGFFAKVFVFWSGVEMYTPLGWTMVAAALLTSVPAIYYYSRPVIKMVAREPAERVVQLHAQRASASPQAPIMAALGLCILGLALGSFVPGSVMAASRSAVSPIVRPPAISLAPLDLKPDGRLSH